MTYLLQGFLSAGLSMECGCGGQEWKQSDQLGGFPIIQLKEDGGLDHSSCGGGRKWLDPDSIIRVESVGFELDVGSERKRSQR